MIFNNSVQKLSILFIVCFVCSALCTNIEEFDYIVVGSGSAGSVLLNRLSKNPRNKVLVLEAGERPPLLVEVPQLPFNLLATRVNWNYSTIPNPRYGFGLKGQYLKLAAGITLGGTGQINHNAYARGAKKSFDEWAANGAFGWDWRNVFPFFVSLEDNRNPIIVANGYHGVGGDMPVQFSPFLTQITYGYLGAAKELGYPINDFNGPNQTAFMPPQGTIKDGRRYSSLQAFINPIVGRRNLKIITSAFVTKVLIDENKRAYGVVYNHKGKLRKAFAKKEVIICAGGLGSPKILMLSGIGPKEHLESLKIPVISDLPVGGNLQDHLGTLLMAFLVDDTFTFREDRITKEDYAEFLTNGTGVLTSLGNIETIGYLSSKYNRDPDFPDMEILWFTDSIASDKGVLFRAETNINDEVWEYFEPFINKDTVTCLPYISRPRSRGFVTLKSANPYDKPLVDFNFFSDPKGLDAKIIVEGLKFCLEMSETKAMKRFGTRPLPTTVPGCEQYEKFSDDYLLCMVKAAPFVSYHYSGTCKMGDESDPSTVVDPTLKVKGVKGLRVVDTSIIPDLPACHTHAVATMIAEKAAHIILNEPEYKIDLTGYKLDLSEHKANFFY